jgi:tetratricopeptide (TPR) repeat protein
MTQPTEHPDEPLEFMMRLADFNLDLLPINGELLKNDPELLRESAAQFFTDYFLKVGGKADVISTKDKIAVTWTPSSLADKENMIQYTANLLRQGAVKHARTILESMVRKYPDDYAVLLSLGNVLIEEQDYGIAINVLQKAVKANPNDVYGWAALGMTYHRKGNIGRALEALNHAESLQPDNPEVLGNIGVVLRKKEPAKALPYLRRVNELKPDHQVYLLALAMCLIDLKNYTEADTILRRIIEIAPYTCANKQGMRLFGV